MADLTCLQCHTPSPAGTRFCSTCGGSMSGASHAGHRSSSGESSVHETRTFPGTSDMPGRQSPREQGTPFGSRYVLLSKIGKGGMGEVWKARDLELDQYVALKMIRPDLLEQPDVLERFKREITVARKVTHRNVTRIYDLGEVEGTRFISMEYLEGLNLKEFIRQEGALPEEKAIPILKAICEGLKAAHDSGVVHRDLKPHKIFIDREGRPQIMDFGIAFSVESSGRARRTYLKSSGDRRRGPSSPAGRDRDRAGPRQIPLLVRSRSPSRDPRPHPVSDVWIPRTRG